MRCARVHTENTLMARTTPRTCRAEARSCRPAAEVLEDSRSRDHGGDQSPCLATRAPRCARHQMPPCKAPIPDASQLRVKQVARSGLKERVVHCTSGSSRPITPSNTGARARTASPSLTRPLSSTVKPHSLHSQCRTRDKSKATGIKELVLSHLTARSPQQGAASKVHTQCLYTLCARSEAYLTWLEQWRAEEVD